MIEDSYVKYISHIRRSKPPYGARGSSEDFRDIRTGLQRGCPDSYKKEFIELKEIIGDLAQAQMKTERFT